MQTEFSDSKRNSLWERRFFLEREHPNILCFAGWKRFSMNEPDKTNYWRSPLQTFNRIHLDILLGQCTLVLLDYNSLNHTLCSYHKMYLNPYLLYAQNFTHFWVLQMQIKPEYHQLNYKSKKEENPKYWKATKNHFTSYQENLHSMICSLLNIKNNSCCFYYLIIILFNLSNYMGNIPLNRSFWKQLG